MDPDQVAGAAGVQYDDLGDTTASADGGCDGDSWARALFRRGWDLSRKATIAGVAATAAPVVAPPLLLLSVAGVALSFPFAAYLASLVATERLMAALLPPPSRAQPYHTCDLEDDEFVDASEAPGGEGLVSDYWKDAEYDAIMEEDERYASLPLSRECRFFEEPVPALNDDEDTMSETEFRFQEAGHELPVLDDREQKEEDSEYITMESEVEREAESEVSVQKSGQDSPVSDIGDRTEEMPPEEVNVSESSVPHDNTLQSRMEGDVTVEMALEEVAINTNLATEEGVSVQMDAIATELPERESLQPSDLVAQERQGMPEAAYVDDILESTLTEDIVLDIGDTSTESVGHNGEENVSTVISVATVDAVVDLSCSTGTPNVSVISDDMMKVESRPDVDQSNQRTGMEHKWASEGFGKKELVEDKSAKTEENKSMHCSVPNRSMAPQDTVVSKSPVQDDQSKREDEVTVEMVLEEVTSTSDLDTGELVGVQVDIIASGSESLPLGDLVAQELQAVTEAAIVDDIQGSTVRGDVVTNIPSSFISGASLVTMDDVEHVSGISGDIKSIKGRPDVEHPVETTGFQDRLTNEGLKREVVSEDKDNYTEEQLREQLDTLRTITGYRPATSLTLEAELAGLYIFVGVEPPASSRDDSDLTEINVKLRFLKSIIGVE